MAFHLNAPQGFGNRLSKALSSSLGEGLGQYRQSHIRQDETRQKLLDESAVKEKKDAADLQMDEKNYEPIKDAFGEKFANVWRATPTGGKTELMKRAIEETLRGNDINSLFENLPDEVIPKGPDNVKSKFPEYKLDTKGMTPAEKIGFRRELRKENADIFQKAKEKTKSTEGERNSIKLLQNIDQRGNLPADLSRFIVNPATGEPFKLAQLTGKIHPDVQQWVKTINQFTTKAKDSYGSRVTNFDLQQFMAQLPTLLNTGEGRQRILRQMEITNDLDNLYEGTLKDIYQNYGIGNITQEDANSMAESMIADEKNKLVEEYQTLGEKGADSQDSQQAPQGIVILYDPSGKPLHVPQEKVEEVLRLGAKRERQ